MKLRLITLALAAAFLLPGSLHAAVLPGDSEGTEEHAEVARFPGYAIDNSSRNDFNEFAFRTKGDDVDGEVKAGKYWFVDYLLKDGEREPSYVELIRNYENAFKKAGGKLIRRSKYSVVFHIPGAGQGGRWVQLDLGNHASRYQVHVIDLAAMEQKIEFSASEMAEAIKADGFVALQGVLFDTGKSTIKPESEPLLGEIVALLKNDKQLKLMVEGHTDNVGDKKANLALSRQRAAAIVTYLTAKGIAAARLQSDGKGDTVPVADNRSEDGRAKNRRVELRKL